MPILFLWARGFFLKDEHLSSRDKQNKDKMRQQPMTSATKK